MTRAGGAHKPRLHDRVAVATGAGAEIGRATALARASAGADVVLAARQSGPLRELADEVHRSTGRRAFDVNVLGVLEVSRVALPHLRRAGGGSIVQISSEAPRLKAVELAAYSATKAAMRSPPPSCSWPRLPRGPSPAR